MGLGTEVDSMCMKPPDSRLMAFQGWRGNFLGVLKSSIYWSLSGAFLGSESWRQDEGTGRGGCLGETVLGGSQAKQNPADISSSMSHSSSENLRMAAPSLPLSWLGKKRFPGETQPGSPLASWHQGLGGACCISPRPPWQPPVLTVPV